LVESQPSKLLVASSSLVSRFILCSPSGVRAAMTLILFLSLLCSFQIVGCIEKKPYQVEKKESPITGKLKEIVDEDRSMRQNPNVSARELALADAGHRRVVYEFLSQSVITEPGDLYRAALILYHSQTGACPETYLLSHYLANEAVDKGYNEARYLAAASLDRYLVASGVPQRYGTQYTTSGERGYRLLPYDSSTTDEERALWNVPQLDSLENGAAKALSPE
jgi:hypothetical protein